MDHFAYRNGRLFAEDVPVADIAATVGTPCYLYSRATIERHWRAFDDAFGEHPHLVCYAVKANSNLAVLNVLARLGSGFDIVSVGELERVVAAGGDPGKVVFSGVGKRRDELDRALELNIRCFNVESEAELALLEQAAADRGRRAPVSLRINPDVDANTHPYISTGLKQNKFGIDPERALAIYAKAAASPHLNVVGMDCHIGSQLTQVAPFVDALERVLALAARLETQGIALHHLDLGGGLGIRYRDEQPPLPADHAAALLQYLRDKPYEILIEPGRAIVGNAGILVTRVELLKQGEDKSFAVVDAAMNDLLRPALYSAWQDIIAVEPRTQGELRRYDVVGPICETGDFLGKDRDLNLEAGDLLAVRSAGAYGFAMSSNYNSRPRVAEVMVDGDRFQVVRRRERIADLYAGESVLPEVKAG
ncbi:MAG: diaminopimelate decarboxylase [Candidatus Contendobacter sp.]|nr:diaminopimelate decarboxylase [Candidatus Contendobacter sp.]